MITSILLFVASLASAAADVATSTPIAVAPVPAASSATAGSTAPLTLEDVVAGLKRLDETVTSLQCGFKQSLTMSDTDVTQESAGRLMYLKPDRIRLEYDKPRKQVTVSDKKDIWIHQIEDNQVIKASWDDWKRTQYNVTGLLDFGNYATILDKHKAELDAPPGKPARLTLRPKDKGTYVLTLVLSPKDLFPLEWSLQLDRMKVRTELYDVRRNGDLPASMFDFKPPKDAAVINFSAPRIE